MSAILKVRFFDRLKIALWQVLQSLFLARCVSWLKTTAEAFLKLNLMSLACTGTVISMTITAAKKVIIRPFIEIPLIAKNFKRPTLKASVKIVN